jgi:L-2-hydroxyglutarate oxidase LhgO
VENYDVVVIGAGIMGLATARSLKIRQPSLKILICEKESEPGFHASGRNSGVLHAGFYYSPDSLKAKFCRDGNRQLREFISSRRIPIIETGKVVVTRSEEEDVRLESLYNRGQINGVKLDLLPSKDLAKFEPMAKTFNSFLWSPTTAVSDPKAITKALVDEMVTLGIDFYFSSKLVNASNGIATLNSKQLTYRHLINAAGSQADRITQLFGVGFQYSMLPFIGMYRYVNQDKLPLKTLVYPVPHPLNPFLGVHFTLTFDGLVKIGPTAIPIVGREQYNFSSRIELKDFKSTFISGLSLLTGKKHSVGQIVSTEFPKFSTRFLVRESAELVPSAKGVRGWKVKPPGIRSQLVNLQTGELVQDFLVEKGENSTHILNAVSPGWTSALPFGDFIADQVLAEL